MAKGFRLLDEKAMLFIQGKNHSSKSFRKIYPLNNTQSNLVYICQELYCAFDFYVHDVTYGVLSML